MRTFDFLVEYERDGQTQQLSFQNSCSGPGLVCEVRREENRLRLSLEPSGKVTLRSVSRTRSRRTRACI